jgi:Type VI secretion system/phage-baseplate injector OB domain
MNEHSYQHFFGKYRGKVTDNGDPLMQGRIRAKVPSVFGSEESGWALPCTPYAGKGVGFFFIPPVDANVWIEFENGNPDYPIWVGCFWGVGEVPKMPAIADTKIIKTDTATITLNDLPGVGGVTIETANGMKIVIDGTGIKVSSNTTSINLTPQSVSINDGALEVMP